MLRAPCAAQPPSEGPHLQRNIVTPLLASFFFLIFWREGETLAGDSRVGIKRFGENIVLSMQMRCSSVTGCLELGTVTLQDATLCVGTGISKPAVDAHNASAGNLSLAAANQPDESGK